MNFKSIVIMLLFALCSIEQSKAQIYAHSWMVGGSLGGSYNTGEISGPGFTEKFTFSQALLQPKIGYFFRQPFAVGLMAEYVYDSHDFKSNEIYQDSSVSFLLAGPFVRYYFGNHIFLEGSFGYGTSTINKREDFSVMRGSAGIGYAAFINERVAIEPLISYVYDQRKGGKDLTYTRGGVALSIGLQVYLYRNPRTIFRQSL